MASCHGSCLGCPSLLLPHGLAHLTAGPLWPGGGAKPRLPCPTRVAGSGCSPAWTAVVGSTPNCSGWYSLPPCSLPASPEQLLSSLLLPLASILVSASSRPYLPPHSLTLSLHTLTSLITSFLSGNSLSHTYWSGQLNLVVISLACRPEIPPLVAR